MAILNTVNFPFTLAPMVGLSHVGLRLLVRSYLPKNARTVFPTEMLNSRRLPHQQLGQTPETYRHESENDLVPQILGNEAEAIQKSVKALKVWGAQGIDINMGCPVRKALNHNYGVALMGEPQYAWDVVRMTVDASDLPVSVKIRAGFQKDSDHLLHFARGLEKAGASWICLHPRIAQEKRRGRADWSQIRMLKENLGIPVVGNGDVQTADDAIAMKEQTQCDMVMIGRSLTARPWLMWQLGERLGYENPEGHEGSAPQTPEEEGREYLRSLSTMLGILKSYYTEQEAMKRFNFHVKVSHVWIDYGHSLYSEFTGCDTLAEMQNVIDRYQANHVLRMSGWTDLRY